MNRRTVITGDFRLKPISDKKERKAFNGDRRSDRRTNYRRA